MSIIRKFLAVVAMGVALGASGHQPSANFLDEIKDLKNQKFPSYEFLDFVRSKDMHFNNIGFSLCMAAERDYYQCDDAEDAPNLGFGICMASGADYYQCDDAIGKESTGFAICMAAERDYYQCDDALGAENLAFGICMLSGVDYYQCDDMLE